jgi:hypothetical protein
MTLVRTAGGGALKRRARCHRLLLVHSKFFSDSSILQYIHSTAYARAVFFTLAPPDDRRVTCQGQLAEYVVQLDDVRGLESREATNISTRASCDQDS